MVFVKSSPTCAESMDGVLDQWSVEVVVIIYRNNSSVYVGYCVVNDILSVSKGCLELVKTSSPTIWDSTTGVW